MGLLWHMASADMGVADHLLGAVHQVLQEPDRYIVVVRQVHADLAGQEVVDLSLAVVLCRVVLGRDCILIGSGVLEFMVRLVVVLLTGGSVYRLIVGEDGLLIMLHLNY